MPIKKFEIIYDDVDLRQFYKNIQWENNIDEKLDFIANQILSYGFNNKNANCTLEELIYFSKLQFIDSINDVRTTYRNSIIDENPNVKLPDDLLNPYNAVENYKKLERGFIKNPIKVLKQYATNEANKEIDENNQEQVNWRNHCREMINRLDDISHTYKASETRIQPKYTTFLISERHFQGETGSPQDILNKTKGGFFERLFRTTSQEYKNFDHAFKEYNDLNSSNYGNKDYLKNAAIAYMRYKLPNFDNDKIPTFNDIYGLTGTSYERMALCISVVEQLENQESLENMDNKISNLDNDISNKIKDQTDFHKKLDNELENQVNIESSIDKNNEISNENLINNDEININ